MQNEALWHQWHSRGDSAAFRELTLKYGRIVYAAALRVVGNAPDAEDVTQECFEKLAQTKRAPAAYLGAWLHRMAVNKALDRLRSDTRRQRREACYQQAQASETDTDWQEIYPLVDMAIDELPDKVRQAVVAHYLQGLTHDDIAEQENVSRSAVTQRIRRGLEQIRRSLRQKGVGVPLAILTAALTERFADAAPMPAALVEKLGRLALSGAAMPAASGVVSMTLLYKALTAILATCVVATGGVVVYHRFSPSHIEARREALSKAISAQPLDTASPAQSAPDSVDNGVSTHQAAPEDTAAVSGKVVDAGTGEGIAGAQLRVASASDAHTITSDEHGAFEVGSLPPGFYAVCCRQANGYYIPWEKAEDGQRNKLVRMLHLAKGEQREGIDFALTRGEECRARVVDSDGQPVAGAKVTGSAEIRQFPHINTARSQDDGTVSLSGFPSTASLFLWAEGDGLVSKIHGPFALPQAGEGPDLLLHPEAIVRGVVEDEQGRPLPGLRVLPQFELHEAGRVKEAISDAAGRFQLTGMPPEEVVLRVCRENEIVNAPCPRVPLSAGKIVEDMVLTCLVGDLSITGHVVDARGKPLSSARVVAVGIERRTHREAETDRDGNFTLTALRRGLYRVTAECDGHVDSAPAEVTAGARGLRLVLADPFQVSGRVIDGGTQRPIRKYELKYCYCPEFMLLGQRYKKVVDSGGSFSLPVAQRGRVRIAARAKGYLLGYADVDLDDSATALRNVVIRLQPQEDLRGSVHDQQGNPIAGALLFSGQAHEQDADTHAAARTKRSGRFTLPAMKLGHKFISIYHPDYPRAIVPLETKHYQGEPIDAVVYVGTSLRCTCLLDGAPCADAAVTANQAAGIGATERTGDDGTCTLKNLVPAYCFLTASFPLHGDADAKARVERYITLEPAQTTDLVLECATGDAVIWGALAGMPEDPFQQLRLETPHGPQKYFYFPGQSPAQSEYMFTDLPPGEATLRVSWRPQGDEGLPLSRRYTFTVTPGQVIRQDIVPTTGASIWGTVTGLHEGERGFITVLFGRFSVENYIDRNYDAMDHCAIVPATPSDGTFHVDDLQLGAYTVLAEAAPAAPDPDAAPRRCLAVVELGNEGAELHLQLPE